jgi:hypothetical protein
MSWPRLAPWEVNGEMRDVRGGSVNDAGWPKTLAVLDN